MYNLITLIPVICSAVGAFIGIRHFNRSLNVISKALTWWQLLLVSGNTLLPITKIVYGLVTYQTMKSSMLTGSLSITSGVLIGVVIGLVLGCTSIMQARVFAAFANSVEASKGVKLLFEQLILVKLKIGAFETISLFTFVFALLLY